MKCVETAYGLIDASIVTSVPKSIRDKRDVDAFKPQSCWPEVAVGCFRFRHSRVVAGAFWEREPRRPEESTACGIWSVLSAAISRRRDFCPSYSSARISRELPTQRGSQFSALFPAVCHRALLGPTIGLR